MLIDWTEIDNVLLDMDGTLLDRHFDDHFWLEHVPARYSVDHDIPIDEAKKLLCALFRSQEKTLNWTDLDYWSDKLGLDIPLLKLEVEHLIAVHPFVVEFLLFLQRERKGIYLVTNAHSKTLNLKMGKTRLGPFFTGIVSAHDLGLPKEDEGFWARLKEVVPFEPERTLLGEDSETNLATAAAYGIRYLVYMSRFSSSVVPTVSKRFLSITYFSQLIPDKGRYSVEI